jgi:hypothetical protein
MAPAEKAVFRQLAIPVSAFDHIKATQRAHAARCGQHLTLNQAVALIVREHQQHNVEREGRPHVAALLQP